MCDAMMNGKCQNVKIAYIERLPDCLLLHILSFLDTCEAVQTSVLSKRWKNLWKYVPCLHLNYAYFADNDEFQNFVCRVLVLHKNKHLVKFRLNWFNGDMQRRYIIDTWLRHISELKPRDLEVEAPEVDLVWFPSYLLSCVTLERLALYIKISERFLIRPKMVNLPFLKSLGLVEVVVHEGIMKGLVYACPHLEELTLGSCSFEISEIVSPTLKHLLISGWYTKLLRVRAPNLVYLECTAPPGLVTLEHMPYLYDARIMFDEDDLGEYDENVVTGLHNLANASSLHLIGEYIKKLLAKESKNCRTFRNLKTLKFGWFNISRSLQPIASFLHLTPNLLNLTLEHIVCCAFTLESDKKIQCCHLKAIEIGGTESDYEDYCELAEIVKKRLNRAAKSIVTINGSHV